MAEPEGKNTSKYNTGFLISLSGILRIVEAVVALAAVISASIGGCACDGKIGFFLFVVVTTFIQAVCVLIIIVFQFDAKMTINLPLTLFFTDGACVVFYFLSSLLMMLSIGYCHHMIIPRILAALFSITNFLIVIALFYLEYMWWRDQSKKTHPEEPNTQTNGATVTEASPTVLTLQ